MPVPSVNIKLSNVKDLNDIASMVLNVLKLVARKYAIAGRPEQNWTVNIANLKPLIIASVPSQLLPLRPVRDLDQIKRWMLTRPIPHSVLIMESVTE